MKGKRRKIRERLKQKEKKKERKITSPGSSVDPGNGMLKVLAAPLPGLGKGTLFIDKIFPYPSDKFLTFYGNYLLCAVWFFRPFWKWVRRLQGSLVIFFLPYWVSLWLTASAGFFISFLHSTCCIM